MQSKVSYLSKRILQKQTDIYLKHLLTKIFFSDQLSTVSLAYSTTVL